MGWLNNTSRGALAAISCKAQSQAMCIVHRLLTDSGQGKVTGSRSRKHLSDQQAWSSRFKNTCRNMIRQCYLAAALKAFKWPRVDIGGSIFDHSSNEMPRLLHMKFTFPLHGH